MEILGYTAPPQRMIMVPNANADVGGGGSVPLPSLESCLQLCVQELTAGANDENGVSSLKWPDSQVSAKLADVAQASGVWLGSLDPDTDPARTAALIVKYTAIFRTAVSTPAPPPLPPWMVHRPRAA